MSTAPVSGRIWKASVGVGGGVGGQVGHPQPPVTAGRLMELTFAILSQHPPQPAADGAESLRTADY